MALAGRVDEVPNTRPTPTHAKHARHAEHARYAKPAAHAKHANTPNTPNTPDTPRTLSTPTRQTRRRVERQTTDLPDAQHNHHSKLLSQRSWTVECHIHCGTTLESRSKPIFQCIGTHRIPDYVSRRVLYKSEKEKETERKEPKAMGVQLRLGRPLGSSGQTYEEVQFDDGSTQSAECLCCPQDVWLPR